MHELDAHIALDDAFIHITVLLSAGNTRDDCLDGTIGAAVKYVAASREGMIAN